MAGLTQAQQGELDVAAVLDVFMYSGYQDAPDGTSLRNIVERMGRESRYTDPNSDNYRQYQILKSAVENNPSVGDLRIQGQSWNQKDASGANKYNEGTNGCVFSDGKGNNYVAFRGTDDGEWIDNGEAMTQQSSIQQREAAQYFEDMCEKYGWTEADNIVVTGHSKGGNKSQYITMDSKYRDLVDTCYSLDGQGFSPEAIEYFKQKYGEDGYQEAIQKMYSVRGENDYVSGLGNRIIPDDHVIFIDTTENSTDFKGHHMIEYMMNWEDGSLNGYGQQSATSKYAEELSKRMMNMPPDQREDCAIVIMQIMEMGGYYKTGLDGNCADLDDIVGFIHKGVPTILYTLLFTESGRQLAWETVRDLLTDFSKNYGVLATIGLVVGVTFLAPLLVTIGEAIYDISVIIDNTLKGLKTVVELLKEGYETLKDVLTEAWNYVKEHKEALIATIKNWINPPVQCNYLLVDHSAISQTREQLQTQWNTIDRTVSELESIRRNMDFGLQCSLSISVLINNNIWSLKNRSRNLKKLYEVLGTADSYYISNENTISGMYQAV